MIGLTAAVTALVMLSVILGERRRWIPRRALPVIPPTIGRHLLALALLALANYELLAALNLERPILSGDLRSHAIVAREIALGRAHGGWIDVYHGGFPLGPHYPSVAWIAAAGLMKLGVAPEWSVLWLGIGAVLLTHVLIYFLSVRVGAPPSAALLGACTLSCVMPLTSFLGGGHAVLLLGVLSQVVATPFVLLLAFTVIADSHASRGVAIVLTAVVATAAHPQVAVCAVAVLAPVAAIRGRACLRRWARSAAASAITGAAIFGPGIAHLHVPFGWPPMDEWLVRGLPPAIFLDRLAEGEVLDFARTPWVTSIVVAALVIGLLRLAQSRPARQVVLTTALVIGACLSGAVFARGGHVGSAVLKFFQPLRAYALLPPVAACLVVLGATEVIRAAREVASRRRWLRFTVGIPGAVALLLVLSLLPAAREEASGRAASVRAGVCGPHTTQGYDAAAVRQMLGELKGGRLTYVAGDFLECAAMSDLDFSSAVPIAFPFVAGAHVGILADAFGRVAPGVEHSDRRAAALGIQYFFARTARPPPTGKWTIHAQAGVVTVYETPADYFGVGCVRRLWRGSDESIRKALHLALAEEDNSRVLNPDEWVAIEPGGTDPVRKSRVNSSCDATHAQVLESKRIGPGQYEARVETTLPVDVVLRETFYDSWVVKVDGKPVTPRMVAPGFLSVSVGPGEHQIAAHFETSYTYLAGLLLAFLAITALASIRRAW